MWVAAKGVLVVALVAVANVASAQAGAAAPPANAAPVDEEIVVRGRQWGELRREILRAEDAVYARFNDINSDDRFDISCDLRPMLGSRIHERACESNSWREEDANYAQALLARWRGEAGANPEQFRAAQLYWQRRLQEELRRLTVDDPQLREAVARLGQAYQAMNAASGSRPRHTLYRSVPPGEDGLPFGARVMLEVQIGNDPLYHRLTQLTFTFAHVFGEIRKVELACDGDMRELAFEIGLEWRVPQGSRACDVRVRARRGTTFALYEFE